MPCLAEVPPLYVSAILWNSLKASSLFLPPLESVNPGSIPQLYFSVLDFLFWAFIEESLRKLETQLLYSEVTLPTTSLSFPWTVDTPRRSHYSHFETLSVILPLPLVYLGSIFKDILKMYDSCPCECLHTYEYREVEHSRGEWLLTPHLDPETRTQTFVLDQFPSALSRMAEDLGWRDERTSSQGWSPHVT